MSYLQGKKCGCFCCSAFADPYPTCFICWGKACCRPSFWLFASSLAYGVNGLKLSGRPLNLCQGVIAIDSRISSCGAPTDSSEAYDNPPLSCGDGITLVLILATGSPCPSPAVPPQYPTRCRCEGA